MTSERISVHTYIRRPIPYTLVLMCRAEKCQAYTAVCRGLFFVSAVSQSHVGTLLSFVIVS